MASRQTRNPQHTFGWCHFLMRVCVLLYILQNVVPNANSFCSCNTLIKWKGGKLFASSSYSDNPDSGRSSNQTEPANDLTDRFKYKVHALMGSYDPPSGTIDDENQMGNILGAMLQFPTEYTFSVVGKSVEAAVDDVSSPCAIYESEVKKVFINTLGPSAQMETRVTPRGRKFTRVTVKVMVESAAVISSIYEDLDALEATVMKF